MVKGAILDNSLGIVLSEGMTLRARQKKKNHRDEIKYILGTNVNALKWTILNMLRNTKEDSIAAAE